MSGYGDAEVAWVLMLFGISSAAGNLWGGHAADTRGPQRVIWRALTGICVLFALLAVVATWMPRSWAPGALLAIIAAWGVLGWSFPPAQQLNLVQRAPQFAPVVLSLNASAIYLGISIGAVLGSICVAAGHLGAIGFVGAACELLALGFATIGYRFLVTRVSEPMVGKLG